MIDQIKSVTIPVSNQDLALEFYTKKLGFKTVTDQPFSAGMRWIELRLPGTETNVVLFTAPGQEGMIGKFSNIIFSCQDVEKTYGDLKRRGVEFVQAPKPESWGTSALFKDQDGTIFCLSSR